MSVRGAVGWHAPNVFLRSPYPVAVRLTHSLRPFSISTARCKPPKIRTRFSGPQPNSAQETVTLTLTKQPAKTTRVSNLQPLGAQDSSVSDEAGISFAETRPFPDQDLSSTRPVALQTPDAPKPQDHGGIIPITVRLSYLYRLGKSYVTFYKTGLKNIWFNYQEYRKIKQRLGPFPLNDVVKYSGKDGRPTISRREYQLCLRTRHDIRKLIPFGLILLICGEFTPLVVLALGSAVVPSTCRIPRQVAKDHVNSARRLRRLDHATFSDEKPSARSRAFLEARVGYLWGLMPSPQPLPLVHHLLRPRVRTYAEEVVCDSILVRREGGLARLEGPELLLFMERASRTRFDRLVKAELDDPIRIEHGQTRKRLALSFEEHVDEILQTLRELEDQPLALATHLPNSNIVSAVSDPRAAPTGRGDTHGGEARPGDAHPWPQMDVIEMDPDHLDTTTLPPKFNPQLGSLGTNSVHRVQVAEYMVDFTMSKAGSHERKCLSRSFTNPNAAEPGYGRNLDLGEPALTHRSSCHRALPRPSSSSVLRSE